MIKSTGLHGIHLSPIYDRGKLVHEMTSTFRFCDAADYQYIKPGETYHFFGNDGSGRSGCIRWFKTVPGYSVNLLITSSSRNRDTLASFYEGEEIKESRKIGSFQGSQEVCLNMLVQF